VHQEAAFNLDRNKLGYMNMCTIEKEDEIPHTGNKLPVL